MHERTVKNVLNWCGARLQIFKNEGPGPPGPYRRYAYEYMQMKHIDSQIAKNPHKLARHSPKAYITVQRAP